MKQPHHFFLDVAGVRRRHPEIFRTHWPTVVGRVVIVVTLAALLVWSISLFEMTAKRLFAGFFRLGDFVILMWPPLPASSADAWLYARGLMESLAIAFLGTLIAAAAAFPVALLAAKNVIPNPFVHFGTRRLLDGVRSIDTLIWALLWVSAVGLGPFAGILAIACSDFGIFGKLFSEAIEASDRGPVEGVRATGATHAQAVRFALVPQVFPVLASQVLYFFESNTRSATIIGIVGAGGIGLHLAELIRTLEWGSMAFVVGMILVAVALIDQVSARLRFAMIGKRSALA